MQGQLGELDIRSILQLIELGQRTGELYIEARLPGVADSNQSWLAFFVSGQLVYAGITDGHLDRLKGHLKGQGCAADLDMAVALELAPFTPPEYGMLWALLEQRSLTPEQGRSILKRLVEETLFDLLSLRQGTFIVRFGYALSPQLTTVEISPLIAQITQQLQDWHQLRPHIYSLQQRPIVVETAFAASSKLRRLAAWANGHTSIAEIARFLDRSGLATAKALYPYVKEGGVQLLAPSVNAASGSVPRPFEVAPTAPIESVPRIVCIDDGHAVRAAVETILDQQGYEVTSIANPLKALGLLFQLRPDLILCDIAMPELEGYELCAMIRQAGAFRATPIVMLTGKDGFIDRVKARMAGATDYLTKPFGKHELLALVERYVGQGDPLRSHPDALLEQEIADVL